MIHLASDRLNRRSALRRLPVLAFAAMVVAGAGLITCTTLSRAESLKDIEKRGYATAVTEDDFRPFEFMEDGVSKGYDNELRMEIQVSEQPLVYALLKSHGLSPQDLKMRGKLATLSDLASSLEGKESDDAVRQLASLAG